MGGHQSRRGQVRYVSFGNVAFATRSKATAPLENCGTEQSSSQNDRRRNSRTESSVQDQGIQYLLLDLAEQKFHAFEQDDVTKCQRHTSKRSSKERFPSKAQPKKRIPVR